MLRIFLGSLLLLVWPGSALVARAQALNGAYTINNAAPTAGRNFASFTAAAAALNGRGVSGPVTLSVSGGPYVEQLLLTAIAGASAANQITFSGNGRTIRFGNGNTVARAVVTLNGASYVTLDSLDIDATVANPNLSSTFGIYGWGILLYNNADNNIIRHCTVTATPTTTSGRFAGIVLSSTVNDAIAPGSAANRNVLLEDNTVHGGYYGITAVGTSVAQPNPGIIIRRNTVRDFHYYGIFVGYLEGVQIVGNDVARPTRLLPDTFYAIYLAPGVRGARVEKNRLHDGFGGAPASTERAYGIAVQAGVFGTAAQPNYLINNLIYALGGQGNQYGIALLAASYTRAYHNIISLDDATTTGSGVTYGFFVASGQNTGSELQNNIVRLTRAGTGSKYAVLLGSTNNTVVNYNNLSGTGTTFVTGSLVGTNYATLADWQTASGGRYDQNSTAADPQLTSPATGDLRPQASALDGTALPLTVVADDYAGVVRGALPDIGAYEFTALTNDVTLVSIDAPTSPSVPTATPVTVTVRNAGMRVLTAVTLAYALNAGPATTQLFTLNLLPGASQQLTFSAGLIALSGSNSLVVTASLPNGQTDNNPGDNVLTLTYQQPTPGNDEPCAAVPLLSGVPVAASIFGASTSQQAGLSASACAGFQQVPDVWFTATVAVGNNSLRLDLTGTPARQVRVFTSPSCLAGPFQEVFCQASTSVGQGLSTVQVPGLLPGVTYYIAISDVISTGNGPLFALTATSTTITSTHSASVPVLQLSPNPTHATTTVTGLLGHAPVQVLDALGREILHATADATGAAQLTLPAGQAAGLYVVRSGRQSRRLVVE